MVTTEAHFDYHGLTAVFCTVNKQLIFSLTNVVFKVSFMSIAQQCGTMVAVMLL